MWHRPRYTTTEISGVAIRAGADKDISCKIDPIAEAADLRRTVNADLRNVARDVFQKFSISISGDDTYAAAFAHLMPGRYAEIISHKPMSLTLTPAATSAEIPRACIDVVGITHDDRRVMPTSQPPDPHPLQTTETPARTATLRVKPTVTFAEPVETVEFRPVLACLIVGMSLSDAERTRSSSWSISAEEV